MLATVRGIYKEGIITPITIDKYIPENKEVLIVLDLDQKDDRRLKINNFKKLAGILNKIENIKHAEIINNIQRRPLFNN